MPFVEDGDFGDFEEEVVSEDLEVTLRATMSDVK
jgi:hypothetical protein